MPSLEQFVATWGYLGIAIGALVEGETMLVLGGLAAYHGCLTASGVMLAGFAGGITGDQLYFYLGRRHGARLIARRPRWQALVTGITSRLDRHRDLFIFTFRFLYGLRVVSPLLIGLTDVSAARYTVINVVGGIVWAVSVTLLALLLGHGTEALVADVRGFELVMLAASAGLLLAWWGVRRLLARRALRSAQSAARVAALVSPTPETPVTTAVGSAR